MPMVTLQVTAQRDERLTGELVRTVTALTASLLGKDPRVTVVAVDFVPRSQWFVAGLASEEFGKSAFFLDVRITDGTNTKEEKSRYIAEAFAALASLLGGVHEASYVRVDDVRADAYGYGGLTQERRFVARDDALSGRHA